MGWFPLHDDLEARSTIDLPVHWDMLLTDFRSCALLTTKNQLSELTRQIVTRLHNVRDGTRGDVGEVVLELLRGAGEEREGSVVNGHDVVDT